ncbi:hypothetical protein CcrColossus_gp378 [Caulobacter phage CcrColossus]|uniref:Uncharacterized protein n=1 Tax=Caulobacter phage CcrColossus TaxID=1211640 RepID=K4JWG6_9CAUD|nr:hypothetical protein CcrColossus_gp378 [Caulobacter phage CcrColossus]AFU88248.1 hypothetical protein CcrColossus_gp378 [Caulobacter phage CcrColossus]
MSLYKQPSDFMALIPELLSSSATTHLDRPESPNGEFWIEIDCNDFNIQVQWTAKYGFGFYKLNEEPVYGQRPETYFLFVEQAVGHVVKLYAEFEASNAGGR